MLHEIIEQTRKKVVESICSRDSVSTYHNVSRLPKLTLPMFDGNSLHWQSFWDSYKAAVLDNSSLSDIQKFNYLKAQIHGDPSRSIAGFPCTSAT